MPPIYEFSCDEDKSGCGEITTIHCKYDDLPKKPDCEHCGKPEVRRLYGFSMLKTTYEQNGRKAIRINTGSGVINRSMTRENHMNGKGTKSVYSKDYQKHVDKQAYEKAAKQKHDAKKARG